MDKVNTAFSVEVYGELTPYNEVMSKARVRIFYKGANRNGSYITDEFADKLISTVTYAPIKGIYEVDDYSDHGEKRTEGRIYGIVPAEHNFAWETHLDKDDVEREYACVDVLLYTGIYPEAKEIIGKPQSMEIYDKSIKGNWKIIQNQRYFVFEEGCFLGLQVLGDDVEPCFEGASFFSLYDSLSALLQKFEAYQKQEEEEGGSGMPAINFKISDDQKHQMIFALLNPNYCEAGNWILEYSICQIFDDYCIAFNYEAQQYERVYYTKNDETDSLELGDKVQVYIVDVSADEKAALDNVRAQHGGSFEKVDEVFASVETLNNTVAELNETIESKNAEISDFEQKVEEFNNSISTLTTERDEITEKFTASEQLVAELQGQVSSLTEENNALSAYQAEVKKNEKLAEINQYVGKLSEEIISGFTAEVDKYELEGLKRELAYSLVVNTPSVFSNDNSFGIVPKEPTPSGLEGYLAKYKK